MNKHTQELLNRLDAYAASPQATPDVLVYKARSHGRTEDAFMAKLESAAAMLAETAGVSIEEARRLVANAYEDKPAQLTAELSIDGKPVGVVTEQYNPATVAHKRTRTGPNYTPPKRKRRKTGKKTHR